MNKKIVTVTFVTLVLIAAVYAAPVLARDRQKRDEAKSPEKIMTHIATFNTGHNGWKYFSIPFDAVVSLENDLRIEYNGQVYNFNEACGNIIDPNLFVFDNMDHRYKPTSVLESGKAYLIYLYVPDMVSLSAMGSFSDSEDPVDLYQGWNFFGMSRNRPVVVADLHIIHDGTDYTWSEAIDPTNGPIVDPSLFVFDNTARRWKYVSMNDEILPGLTYCIYNYCDSVEIVFNSV